MSKILVNIHLEIQAPYVESLKLGLMNWIWIWMEVQRSDKVFKIFYRRVIQEKRSFISSFQYSVEKIVHETHTKMILFVHNKVDYDDINIIVILNVPKGFLSIEDKAKYVTLSRNQ